LRLWPFNHRKPFGRWKALTSNGSDPLNAPYPGRTGDKSNLKRQGHGMFPRAEVTDEGDIEEAFVIEILDLY
jgi:hypothetical protein